MRSPRRLRRSFVAAPAKDWRDETAAVLGRRSQDHRRATAPPTRGRPRSWTRRGLCLAPTPGRIGSDEAPRSFANPRPTTTRNSRGGSPLFRAGRPCKLDRAPKERKRTAARKHRRSSGRVADHVIADAAILHLAIEGRASNAQLAGDLGHLTAIVRKGEADRFGLNVLEGAHLPAVVD